MNSAIITDIEGIINELNISEEDVLYPLFEAIVNSIQSISEGRVKNGKINVKVNRDRTKTELFEQFSSFPITDIIIEDNGIGFTQENYQSFLHAHSTKKIKLGGKGVGRFAMLAIFNEIAIDSIINKTKDNHISFALTRSGGISNYNVSTTKNPPKTIVKLSSINKGYLASSARFNDDEIINNIIAHCLLYFISGTIPQITYENSANEIIDLNKKYNPNYFVLKKEDRSLCGRVFSIFHVKSVDAKFHEICLCGNGRLVKTKRLDSVIPIFSSAIITDEEPYFLKTYVISEYLDSIVKLGRNEFAFPKEKELDDAEEDSEINFEEPIETLCESSIYKLVINSIRDSFPDELSEREKKVKQNVSNFINQDNGIEFRHITYSDSFYANIKDGASEFQLYKALQRHKYRQSLILKKKEEKLLKRDFSQHSDYQNLLKEYVDLRTQENSSLLAKYVCHRRAILDLLEKYLTWSDNNNNYEEESALHNLIFTMGEDSTTKAYDEHNLWLLDDRLTFHRFIYSDKQIRLHKPNNGKTDCKKETDIAIYDIPFGYDDEDDYGNANSVVIFELKKPDRILSVEEYKKQMKEQVKGIREGRRKKFNGQNLQIKDNTPIYFYYVVDSNAFNKLKNDLIDYEHFKETPYNSLINLSDTLVQEILTYQTLLVNAKRRNKIFFDKLGISH